MMGRIPEKYIFVFYRGAKRQKCILGELRIADLKTRSQEPEFIRKEVKIG